MYRYLRANKAVTPNMLYQDIEARSGGKVSTLRRYVRDGTACCALVGAGMFTVDTIQE